MAHNFEELFALVDEGLVLTDDRGVVVEANPHMAELLGCEPGELGGRVLKEFLAGRGELPEVGAEGELELVLIHDRKGPVAVCGRAWSAEGGTWYRFRPCGRFFDSSRVHTQFLSENSEDIIWTMDGDLRYSYVSPSVERIRGYTPGEMEGRHFSEFMDPGWGEELTRFLQQAMAEDEQGAARGEPPRTRRAELPFRHKDGSMVWSESVSQVLFDNGRAAGFVGVTRNITDRRIMEERLRTSEQSLQAMINATSDSMGLFTLDGEVLAVNRNFSRFLGQSGEKLLGQNIFDFIPDPLQPTVRGDFGTVTRTGETVTRQLVWSGRILDGSVYPVHDDEGLVVMIAVYGRDVTESRFAEEAQKKIQEQYRLIVETANEGILGLDADMRVTYVNNIVAEFLGRRPEAIIGRMGSDILGFNQEDGPDGTRLTMSEPQRYERRFERPDGSTVWGMVSSTPLATEDGRLLGAFAMIADITEVKEAHERLTAILDSVDASIYVADFETDEIYFMNARMRMRFGSEWRGFSCHRLMHDRGERCPDCIKASLVDADGEPTGTFVSERHYLDENAWYLTHDRTIRWLGGRLVHMHMATDITELKTMAAELEQAMLKVEAASTAKTEFLANMSHEIRTPLNGLLGMLQLLQLTSLEAGQRDYLDTALTSGRNLLQILNDILDLSKVESGKLELEDAPFELGEVLDAVVSTFRHDVEGRGLSMDWAIDESGGRHFLADKGRLRQILFNLVGNAVKFTDQGAVQVRASVLPQDASDGRKRLFFEVRDTGIGIPDDKLDEIFKPFTQVDGSTTRKYQGTGLGLGIVQRLVRLMGGTVTVDSTKGMGTTICFTILARQGEPPDTVGVVERDGQKVTGLSVLVAEDERVNRVVIERILKKIGHVPTCVESGEAALHKLQDTLFDVFLTDIQMPGLDGVETTRVIRRKMELDLPIVALTAHAMQGDRDRFMAAGMNGYIAKPFEMDQLRGEIERVVMEAAAQNLER